MAKKTTKKKICIEDIENVGNIDIHYDTSEDGKKLKIKAIEPKVFTPLKITFIVVVITLIILGVI